MDTRRTDPIIAELRAFRQVYAARFDYDVEAMFRDIRARQEASGREYVRLPARRAAGDRSPENPGAVPHQEFQPLVRALMRTLLDDRANLLSESEKRDLTDNEYCKSEMSLDIVNLGLLRRIEEGREIKGHGRYWKDRYGGFYVCSQWWRDHHRANAESLLRFVEGLVRRKPEHAAALRPHAQAFRDYLRAKSLRR